MMCQLGCSMAWMLEAAHLSSDGVAGKIKIAGLTGLWLRCMTAWIVDDSKDMSRTMAALDRSLGRVDLWAEAMFRVADPRGGRRRSRLKRQKIPRRTKNGALHKKLLDPVKIGRILRLCCSATIMLCGATEFTGD